MARIRTQAGDESLDVVHIQLSELAKKIYELVSTRRHVSFAELQLEIPGFCYEPSEERKAQVFVFSEHPSVVIWMNLTEEAQAALRTLTEAKKIFLKPCNPLIYLIDGCSLNLPIPKRLPNPDSKKDWWVPCTLDIEPFKKAKKKLSKGAP